MSREILFRGQRKDNGEWVYGYYSPANIPLMGCVGHFINEGGYRAIEIDPETAGQFTGLLDKNGTKIFEGDIVHILGDPMVNDWKDVDYNALIAFLDGGFCALDGTIEEYGFRRYALERMDFSLEVIGTIHDNPELMEVQDER